MDPKEAYKFCPKCGGKSEPQAGNFTQCTQCGFKLFINASVGTGAIITNEKGEILLIKRGQNPGKGQWDVPGGFVDPYTESMEDATVREAKEEMNMDIEVGEMIYNSPNTYLYQDISIPMMDVFLIAKWVGGNIKHSDEEVLEYKFFPPQEAVKQDLWAEPIRNALKKFVDRL